MSLPKYSCGSDDITFCADKCSNHKCFRHKSNIIEVWKNHSFANCKNTKLCPMSEKKETKSIKRETGGVHDG